MKYARDKGLRRFLAASLGFALVPAVVVGLFPRLASGTDEMMQQLPAYERFQCLNCHAIPSPTTQVAHLNPFGADFLANEAKWNLVLAQMNSDGDRCSNGSELGDRDGNGTYDHGGRPRENGNPGNSQDCTAPIDAATWGIIKDLFSRDFEEFETSEPETDFYALYFAR